MIIIKYIYKTEFFYVSSVKFDIKNKKLFWQSPKKTTYDKYNLLKHISKITYSKVDYTTKNTNA